MSKKYFLKYLPVEGEIKEGDDMMIVNHPLKGEIRHCHWIAKDQPAWSEEHQAWDVLDDVLYIDAREDKGSGFLYRKEAKKVKLFLCSRDIQVGDKCKGFTGGEWFDVEVSDPSKLVETYKVIGEVSPDTLGYVKEGDEFDESELMWTVLPDTSYDSQTFTAWDEKDNHGYDYVAIKGPCGHYH